MLTIRREQIDVLSAEVLERRAANVICRVEERLLGVGVDPRAAETQAERAVRAGLEYGLVAETDLLAFAGLAEHYPLPWDEAAPTRWMHERMVDALIDDPAERLLLLREAVAARELTETQVAAARAEFLSRRRHGR